MDEFEVVLVQHQRMIYSIIAKLHIFKNKEEFYQIGVIALWEAYQKFDPLKGIFSSYAYQTIKGRMLLELQTSNRIDVHEAHITDEFLLTLPGPKDIVINTVSCPRLFRDVLTPNQLRWFVASIIEGKTTAEIAAESNVSLAAVKSWKRHALKKMRKAVFQSERPINVDELLY